MGEYALEPLLCRKYRNSTQRRVSLWYYVTMALQKGVPNIPLFVAELGEGDRSRIQRTNHKHSATGLHTDLS